MAGRFSIETIFKAIDRVTAPVRGMQRAVSRFTRAAHRGLRTVGRAFATVQAGIKRVGVAAVAGFTSISLAARNVIGVGAEFGRAIGAAAAKFPEGIQRGSEAFRELERVAREVGSTTEFTATQAAQGLNFLAKAGFSASFSMRALPRIVNFATASEIEFAEAADIASDAIGAFGLDSDNLIEKMAGLQRTMDVMSKTANSSNTSVAELFETVRKGAPVAVQAGQSVETFAAIAGTLAGVGIKGSDAGTATKNIALALAGVGNQAGKAFRQLRIPLVTAEGKMRDVADVFEDLSAALDGMPQDKVVAFMNAIFGKISLAAAMNLLGNGAKKIRELRTVLEQAGGSSKRTAEFIRDDVKGSIDGLNSAVEGVKISIFSLNEGPLKDAIDSTTAWVRANEKLIASKIGEFVLKVVNNADKIVDTIKRIGKALVVFWTLMAVLKTLIGVLTIVNIVMAANPAFWIALGIVALIAAIAASIIWWDKLKAAFLDFVEPARAGLADFLQLTEQAFSIVGNKIKTIWFDVKQSILGVFTSLIEQANKVIGLANKASRFFTGRNIIQMSGRGESQSPSIQAQMISPQERTARSVEERRETSTAEVTIRDETGRAELTRGVLGPGLSLQPSGAF